MHFVYEIEGARLIAHIHVHLIRKNKESNFELNNR